MPSTQPTELERIILLENNFNQIINSSDLSKIIKKFEECKSELYYNYIINYLCLYINFDYQYANGSITDIYLLGMDGEIIISYTYDTITLIGNFSTFANYELGLNFKTSSEEQELLNRFETLNTINKSNVNLLQEPIANFLLLSQYLLYYMVSQKYINIKKKQCENNKYYLVGFIYKNIVSQG